MLIREIELKNFRNYKSARLQFAGGLNLIQGENGQGKTNLLEAIQLLSMGRSFRTPNLQHLIYQGESFFTVEAEFERDETVQTLQFTFDGKTRSLKHNQTPLSNLLGLFNSVLYCPRDIQLIGGSPQERRRFINVHIAQAHPIYGFHLMRYMQAMKQRNSLLKSKRLETIEVWEDQMARSGALLIEKRASALQYLNEKIAPLAKDLSGCDEEVSLKYEPSLEGDEVSLRATFGKERSKEMEFGSTLNGPHRDDFQICIESQVAKTFSSEGQKRSSLAALRLAEWERLKALSSDTPVMAIDDFGIHLDKSRIMLFEKQLKNLGQVFLTTPLTDEIENLSPEQIFTVSKGDIRKIDVISS